MSTLSPPKGGGGGLQPAAERATSPVISSTWIHRQPLWLLTQRSATITLLKATKYLHEKNVAHRDLKPENILLKNKGDAAAIKITDFGLSKIFFAEDAEQEVLMKTACGTPGYVAPEVLSHEHYTSQVDLWSIGVIVYILLCGFPPFYGDNDAQMFKRIKAGQYKFLAPYWDTISADAKDFVRNLLIVEPKKRMTAAEALNHRWLGRTANSSVNYLSANVKPPAKGTAKGEDNEEGTDGIRAQMLQYSVDRKVALPDRLRKEFGLPDDEGRLAKFTCSLGNVFGQMHITTSHVCFIGIGKKLLVPLNTVTVLAKRKRFFFSPGTGHSLFISQGASPAQQFHGITDRDRCLSFIVGQCTKAGVSPTILEPGEDA